MIKVKNDKILKEEEKGRKSECKKPQAMKRAILLSALLIISSVASSQTADDIQNILLLSFENAEMPAGEHLNDAGVPVLVITGEGVLPDNLDIHWFGEPVLQLSMEEISAQNIDAYLVFEHIIFNEQLVDVTYLYYSSQPVQDLSFRFEKVDGVWEKVH